MPNVELEIPLTTLDMIKITGVTCMESMAFELVFSVSSISFMSFALTLSLNFRARETLVVDLGVAQWRVPR